MNELAESLKIYALAVMSVQGAAQTGPVEVYEIMLTHLDQACERLSASLHNLGSDEISHIVMVEDE